MRTGVTLLLQSLIVGAALIAATPVSADVYCGADAPPTQLLTYADGAVLIHTSWRGDFFRICNLNQKWKGVEPSVCFAWMSKIAGAINAGKRVGIWYGGITGDVPHTTDL